ncbi:MAG: thiamine phosphate synthase [Clostridiaceae bacterium]|jgi:thiamine-phosphate pyrophosphorylase|nr:thiamine phosphate synthase [Clostridiaceae bacterium]
MRLDKKHLLLYAVTDRAWIGKNTLCEQVEDAIKGGATCIQLREKELSFDEFLLEAARIKKACEKHGVPFIINDNVEIAAQIAADGVHVGQSDMTAAEVRKIIGADKILGVSVSTVADAVKVEADGADYLGVGAAFNTSTKTDAVTVSHKTLTDICKAVQIPVVAIGGITRDNILKLSGTGIVGVAVVSAIFASRDIVAATRELKLLAGVL